MLQNILKHFNPNQPNKTIINKRDYIEKLEKNKFKNFFSRDPFSHTELIVQKGDYNY